MIEIKMDKLIKISRDEYNQLVNFFADLKEQKIQIKSATDFSLVINSDSGKQYIFTRELGKLQDVIIIPSHTFSKTKSRKRKKRKISTIKGNIFTQHPGRTLLAATAASVIIACNVHSIVKDTDYQPIAIETITPTPETYQSAPKIVIVTEQETTNVEKQTNKEQEERPVINDVNVLKYKIEQSNRMGKRAETHEKYGIWIDKYTTRIGIPNCIGEALITQERHDTDLLNIGQLTRQICGEEIIIPIINKTEMDRVNHREVEKVFVVRDKPDRNNYESENSYQKQLEIYKNQLETSKNLAKEGYEIIYFENLLGEQNIENNIRVSMLWFAHCIYHCQNKPNNGLRGYNSGYTSVRNASDDDIMNGISGGKNSDVWYNYNVYQFLYPEEAENVTYTLCPFPDNWMYMSKSEKNRYLQEEIQNTPLLQTTISLPLFEQSQENKYNYENEEKTPYNL